MRPTVGVCVCLYDEFAWMHVCCNFTGICVLHVVCLDVSMCLRVCFALMFVSVCRCIGCICA